MLPESKHNLELLIERVNKVKSYKFVKQLLEQKGTSYSFTFDVEKGFSETHNIPGQEETDAIALTARMFVQDNDPISIRNLSKLLDDPGISPEWKTRFEDSRNVLNEHLDSGIGVKVGEAEPTHREVFFAILYGELAHSDAKEREKLDVWKKNPIVVGLLKQVFATSIYNVFATAANISTISEEEISKNRR